MLLKWTWLKYSKIFKNDQDTSKPKNYQNTPQDLKNDQNLLWNPKNYQNTPQKLEKLPKYSPKPKKHKHTVTFCLTSEKM